MVRTFSDFIIQFGVDELPDVVKIGRRYFYDPKGLLKLAEEKRWEAFSVGLYLGEEKGQFYPTSALVDLLAARSDKRVVVGSKAAWLFLCGRDILMEGVLEPGVHKKDELVFVADHNENIIGYGRIFTMHNASWRNKIYVKHILDKGEYLRRER
jgi:ribosome biogenesis protein Nip4